MSAPNEKFDASLKNFLIIMGVKNIFLELLLLFIAVLLTQVLNLETCIEWYMFGMQDGIMPAILVNMGMVLPVAGVVIISYKILQFWDDLKHGSSR